MQTASAEPWRSPVGVRHGRLVAAVLTAGVILRMGNYSQNASLWLDEASLALNLATRSFGGLGAPLDYNQAAPVLFLWAERLVLQVGGINEWALRLVPLLAGLAGLFLFVPLALRLLSPSGATVAISLAAFSPVLILYSAELKPYSIDFLLGVVVIILGLQILENPSLRHPWSALLAVGVLGLLASTPAPIVLGGAGIGLAVSTAVRRSPLARRWLGINGLIFAALTIFLFLVFYRAADSAYLHTVWRANFLTAAFPSLPERAWVALREIVWLSILGERTGWLTSPARELVINVGSLALVGCAVLGVARFWERRGAATVVLVLGSTGLTLLASALERYPIALRLVLFTVPSLILLLAAGMERLSLSFAPDRGKLLLGLVASLLVCRAAAVDLLQMVDSDRAENGRGVIAALERRHRPGEPIYIYARGLPVWAFYTTDWHSPDRKRLDWFRARGGLGGPAFENAPSRGRPVAPHEGHDLVYEYRGRSELLGLSTGVQWLALGGLSREGPDAGWAKRESARIREVAHPTAWMFVAHPLDNSHQQLLAELQSMGGRIVYQHLDRLAGVFQLSFE